MSDRKLSEIDWTCEPADLIEKDVRELIIELGRLTPIEVRMKLRSKLSFDQQPAFIRFVLTSGLPVSDELLAGLSSHPKFGETIVRSRQFDLFKQLRESHHYRHPPDYGKLLRTFDDDDDDLKAFINEIKWHSESAKTVKRFIGALVFGKRQNMLDLLLARVPKMSVTEIQSKFEKKLQKSKLPDEQKRDVLAFLEKRLQEEAEKPTAEQLCRKLQLNKADESFVPSCQKMMSAATQSERRSFIRTVLEARELTVEMFQQLLDTPELKADPVMPRLIITTSSPMSLTRKLQELQCRQLLHEADLAFLAQSSFNNIDTLLNVFRFSENPEKHLDDIGIAMDSQNTAYTETRHILTVLRDRLPNDRAVKEYLSAENEPWFEMDAELRCRLLPAKNFLKLVALGFNVARSARLFAQVPKELDAVQKLLKTASDQRLVADVVRKFGDSSSIYDAGLADHQLHALLDGSLTTEKKMLL